MENKTVVKELWSKFSSGEYESSASLFVKKPKIVWPTSREYYDDIKKFIEVNELFGRDWTFEIKVLDAAESGRVISVIYTTSPSHEASFYATSIFEFSEGLIEKMETYWAFEDKQPEWRKGVSQVY